MDTESNEEMKQFRDQPSVARPKSPSRTLSNLNDDATKTMLLGDAKCENADSKRAFVRRRVQRSPKPVRAALLLKILCRDFDRSFELLTSCDAECKALHSKLAVKYEEAMDFAEKMNILMKLEDEKNSSEVNKLASSHLEKFQSQLTVKKSQAKSSAKIDLTL